VSRQIVCNFRSRSRADAGEPVTASFYCADSILQHNVETLA